MKKINLYVQGMHCKACENLIAEKTLDLPGVVSAKCSLRTSEIAITLDKDRSFLPLVKKLNSELAELGYTISDRKIKNTFDIKKDFFYPFGIALIFILLFLTLQLSGFLKLYNPTSLSLVSIFIIGVLASVSSCMAVVGGLVLSLSASFAETEPLKAGGSLLLFHLSRIFFFYLFGGFLGLLGSFFTISPTTNMVMIFLLFFVLLMLGINLIDIPKISAISKFSAFSGVSSEIMKSVMSHKLAPILLGMLTFFLPCGFTQGMQFFALSTGSFFQGSLTMLVFSLGTFPVLAGISFASVKISQSKKSKLLFRSMGYLIIAFALINLLSFLTLAGFISPIFIF